MPTRNTVPESATAPKTASPAVHDIITYGRPLTQRQREHVRRAEHLREIEMQRAHEIEEATRWNGQDIDDPGADVYHEATKGGKTPSGRFSMSKNFLATDEVPETIFGIPVVSREEDYTEKDVAFFREHPEAGGYYDLGDEEAPVEEAPVEERPMQAANKGGDTNEKPKVQPGKFKGWRRDMYRSYEDALKAEAAAVAFVNEGIVDAPPLTEGDLADSRKSAQWLKDNERKGLVKEGTLPHVGRPRFRSLHGFYDSDKEGFQGDRFSVTVAVDQDAFEKDPAAYEKTGQWAVIPTIYPDSDGRTRLHTRRDAEAEYRKSGGHFGIYEGVANGDLGATWDHHKGNAEWAERETRQDFKGGKARKKYPGISNNPGNVEKHERRTDHTLFHGEIEGGMRPERFANFDNPTNGLNAAGVVIVRRGRDLRNAGKSFTIENYAPRYAPPTENDTEKYIRNLSKYSGIARDAVLDPLDNASMSKLLKTVVRFESGYPHSEWFTDDEYTTAARMMADEERANPVVRTPAKNTAAPSPSAKKRITTAPRGSTRSKGKKHT